MRLRSLFTYPFPLRGSFLKVQRRLQSFFFSFIWGALSHCQYFFFPSVLLKNRSILLKFPRWAAKYKWCKQRTAEPLPNEGVAYSRHLRNFRSHGNLIPSQKSRKCSHPLLTHSSCWQCWPYVAVSSYFALIYGWAFIRLGTFCVDEIQAQIPQSCSTQRPRDAIENKESFDNKNFLLNL